MGTKWCLLPVPPSANRYWRHARGRTYLGPEAKAYRRTVALVWDATQRGMFAPTRGVKLTVQVTLVQPWKTRVRGDSDNLLKVLLDALQGHAYLRDSQVDHVGIRRRWRRGLATPHIEVTITEGPAWPEG